MSSLTDLSVKDFLSLTASDAPAPGGGSVSALAGALAASLAAMVAHLSVGEKYADVCGEMRCAAEEADILRKELEGCVQKDTDSFSQYMAALKLPKDTEENIAHRRAAMQDGLKYAASVPMETAETALKIFRLSRLVAEKGNRNALSDGLVSAMLARTAVLGALLNVRINLAGVKDEDFVKEMTLRAESAKEQAVREEKAVLRLAELSDDFAQ